MPKGKGEAQIRPTLTANPGGDRRLDSMGSQSGGPVMARIVGGGRERHQTFALRRRGPRPVKRRHGVLSVRFRGMVELARGSRNLVLGRQRDEIEWMAGDRPVLLFQKGGIKATRLPRIVPSRPKRR